MIRRPVLLSIDEMAETIIFETSMGNFEFELYANHAPKTCFNFARLAEMGYYNDTIFHRVIKDFVSYLSKTIANSI